MRADLHTHSTASDGSREPAGVMLAASAAGLDAVALTDHDTVAGHGPARAALPAGLTLLPGMELSCRRAGHSVHLLAYLFDPADEALAAESAAIRRSRDERARAMVERLRELGADVSWQLVTELAGGGVVGRPHIARALASSGVVGSPQEAFSEQWIGSGGRAHVTRYAPDPVRAVALVSAAGGASVLAHPAAAARGWVIPDNVIAELAAAGLAGLEVDHPDHGKAERGRLGALARDLDLVATAGSDDHGELTGYRIGCETMAGQQYEALVARSGRAGLVTG
ncbi:MAG TPA: PHP domain-containing protein [Streptosporangiaceae bacterium]